MLAMILAAFATTSAYAVTYESVYVGIDSRKKACELRVIKTYHAGNTGKWADFRAEVTTDDSHGNATPGEVVIKPDPKNDKLVLGENSEKTSIRVLLAKSEEFDTASAYGLKWLHHDHFHNVVCKELKLKPKTP